MKKEKNNNHLENTKNLVIQILEKYPETRNSDHELELRYLLETGLATRINNGIYITFDNYRKKCLATIRRIRRKIQEQGYYLPTNNTVKQRRLQKEKEMREIFKPTPYNQETWKPYSPNTHIFIQKTLFTEEDRNA